jgi:hypothetical protein
MRRALGERHNDSKREVMAKHGKCQEVYTRKGRQRGIFYKNTKTNNEKKELKQLGLLAEADGSGGEKKPTTPSVLKSRPFLSPCWLLHFPSCNSDEGRVKAIQPPMLCY